MPSRRIGRAWPVGLLLAVVVAGCKSRSAIAPAAGSSTHQGSATRHNSVPRIVSTVPAATAMLVEMGAASRLVGVSRFDLPFLPAKYQRVPVVGDYLHIDVETLLAARPTLLIVQVAEARLKPRLERLARRKHIVMLNVKLNTLPDLYATATRLGQAARCRRRAAGAIARLKRALAAIALKYRGSARPRVLMLIASQPMIAVGARTFLSREIALAGGKNAGATLGPGYPTLDAETLVRLRPDAVLVGDPGGSAAAVGDQRLRFLEKLDIPAARNHRIFLLRRKDAELATLNLAADVKVIAADIHRAR